MLVQKSVYINGYCLRGLTSLPSGRVCGDARAATVNLKRGLKTFDAKRMRIRVDIFKPLRGAKVIGTITVLEDMHLHLLTTGVASSSLHLGYENIDDDEPGHLAQLMIEVFLGGYFPNNL